MSKTNELETVEKKEQPWYSVFLTKHINSAEIIKNYGSWVPPSEEEAL